MRYPEGSLQSRNESYRAGHEYASDLLADPKSHGLTVVEPVDIAAQVQSTSAMPDSDYRTLRDTYDVEPDPREYWRGFNDAISAAIEAAEPEGK